MKSVRNRTTHKGIRLLDAALLHWLTLGLLALLLVPSTHWHNAWIGWLPFWGAVMPALPLALRSWVLAMRQAPAPSGPARRGAELNGIRRVVG